MEQKEKSNISKRKYYILFLQVFASLFLVISVLLFKTFSADGYKEIKNGYEKYFEKGISADFIMSEDKEEKSENYTVTESPETIKTVFQNNSFLLPVSGEITSVYGYRDDPFTGERKLHKGTDIASDYGTLIKSAAAGVVSFVGYDENGYGNYCTVRHSDGVKTLYGHCSEILVNKGEEVSAGQVIAKVGSSGVSTGNHLHFEIRVDEIPVNAEWFYNGF